MYVVCMVYELYKSVYAHDCPWFETAWLMNYMYNHVHAHAYMYMYMHVHVHVLSSCKWG